MLARVWIEVQILYCPFRKQAPVDDLEPVLFSVWVKMWAIFCNPHPYRIIPNGIKQEPPPGHLPTLAGVAGCGRLFPLDTEWSLPLMMVAVVALGLTARTA